VLFERINDDDDDDDEEFNIITGNHVDISVTAFP